MKPTFIYFIIFCALFPACNSNKSSNKNNNYFDITGFFNKEIKRMQKENPSVSKTVVEGEFPEISELDSLNWERELAAFYTLEINKDGLEKKYQRAIDSQGSIRIETYTALDTQLFVQRIAVTHVAGKLQLIEGSTKKRSFVVDREVKYSYQPGKGYGVVVSENYLWSSPSGYEIFVQIKNKQELYR